MLNNSTFFVGFDLGDKHSHVTLINREGKRIEESRLPTTKASLRQKFSTLPNCRVAMEVGAHSRWVSHLLKEFGHYVLVANARKLRAIYHNPRKGDRDPQLRITTPSRCPSGKTGNSYLRRLLASSAQYILGPFGPDCELHAPAAKIAERGGMNAKKRAVVGVARKLAVLLHRLWKTGEIYDPFYIARKHDQAPNAIPTAA